MEILLCLYGGVFSLIFTGYFVETLLIPNVKGSCFYDWWRKHIIGDDFEPLK